MIATPSIERSPGGKIAFVSDRESQPQIDLMNPDGSGPQRLTHDSLANYAPAWSPDGTQVAFTSNRDGNFEIMWRLYQHRSC